MSDEAAVTRHVLGPGTTWAELAPVLADVLDGAGGSIVVETSGSSGTPKRVELPGPALRASGEATEQIMGGPGRWVLALPPHHVAGLQVLARSVLAGTEPVALPSGMPFRADSFAVAVERAGSGGHPVYTSLVPTQLHRLVMDAGGEGTRALAAVDAVLLGGAAADPGLLARAREHTRVITTYGMSETCGGCVYDGTPLPGVRVRVDAEGRILLGGAVLAAGYVDLPDLTAERFVEVDGRRWFRTDDRGRWQDPSTPGRLQVLGRVDDVINTGGHKVEPRDVEAALAALPQVGEAVVVGLPDPEWGQVVAALLTPSPSTTLRAPVDLTTLRAALAPTLPPHAVPRRIAWSDHIPLLPSGKPDRAAARARLDRPGDA